MAGSNWQQLAGGSVNPYDVLRDDGTPTADYGQHIICDGGTVTLPSPQANEAVLVSNISQGTTVTASTGLVEQESDVTHSPTATDPVLFVSDGSDWYVANNLDYLTTIPDSAFAQYDATRLSLNDGDSVSTWADETGNGNDVTAGSAPTYVASGINGNPSVDFASNRLDTSITTTSQPITIIAVVEQVDNSGDNRLTSGGSEDFDLQIDVPNDRYSIFDGSGVAGGSPDGTPHVFTGVFDTGNSALRIDGIQIASGSVNGADLTGITLGERYVGGDALDGLLGAVEYHDGTPSNGLSSREQYWADEFGITL